VKWPRSIPVNTCRVPLEERLYCTLGHELARLLGEVGR